MSSNNRKIFDIPTQYAMLFGKIDLNNQNVSNMSNKPTEFESVLRAQQALGGCSKLPEENVLANMAESAANKMLNSDRGQELLFKADKYNMPIDKSNIDWLQLIDDIEEYENLLLEAIEVGVIWDESEYDPVPLQQEIEDARHLNFNDSRVMLSDFHASRGVEV